MTDKLWLAPLLAMGLAAAPALASDEPAADAAQAEARIPFANHGGIRNWRPGGRDYIYVQDRHRRWYKATLMARPIGLRSAWAIGFETRGTGTFDKFSNIVVEGFSYPLQSLVRIEGDPPRRSRGNRDQA